MNADRKQSPTVVVVGDALIDEVHEGGNVRRYIGGAALNVAVRLSSLGATTKLIAMVGDDPDAAVIHDFLDRHGVELIPTIGPLGTARSASERVNGEPHYSFTAAAVGRRVRVGEAEAAALADADLVALSCFPFDDAEQTNEVIGAIPDPASRLIVDPNPRSALLNDRVEFLRGLSAVASRCRLMKLSDEDARLLDNSTVDQLAARMVRAGAGAVLATLGSEGAWVRDDSGQLAREPIVSLPEPIVDTMGAGDATLSSVIYSILRDGFPADSAEWHTVLAAAMLFAAETCRHEGALAQTAF